jgi:hypothetical protein
MTCVLELSRLRFSTSASPVPGDWTSKAAISVTRGGCPHFLRGAVDVCVRRKARVLSSNFATLSSSELSP